MIRSSDGYAVFAYELGFTEEAAVLVFRGILNDVLIFDLAVTEYLDILRRNDGVVVFKARGIGYTAVVNVIVNRTV